MKKVSVLLGFSALLILLLWVSLFSVVHMIHVKAKQQHEKTSK